MGYCWFLLSRTEKVITRYIVTHHTVLKCSFLYIEYNTFFLALKFAITPENIKNF